MPLYKHLVWSLLNVDKVNRFSQILCNSVSDLQLADITPLYTLSLLSEVRRTITLIGKNTFEDAHEFIQAVMNNLSCDNLNLLIVTHTSCLSCQHYTMEDDEQFGISLVLRKNLEESLSSFLKNN